MNSLQALRQLGINQCGLCRLGVDSRINGLQSSGYGLAVLVAHGMAQQMDNACLDLCLWKGRLDGLWEALEAVNYGDEDVLNAPSLRILTRIASMKTTG